MKSCWWLLLEVVPKQRTTILQQLQKIHRPPSTIWRKMTRKTTRRHASFFNSNLRDAPPPKTSLHKVWFSPFLGDFLSCENHFKKGLFSRNCERSEPCSLSNLARKFKCKNCKTYMCNLGHFWRENFKYNNTNFSVQFKYFGRENSNI